MYKAAAIILIALITMFSFIGCNNNAKKIESEFEPIISSDLNSENIKSAAEFLDENISKLKKDKATETVIKYRKYLLDYIIQNKDKTTLQELKVYMDRETGLINGEKIQNSVHKTFYDEIKMGNLMVILYEDTTTLKVDYHRLIEKYGEYISESLRELFLLEEVLVERPSTENATLVIPWEELVARAHEAEQLIIKYEGDENIIDDAMWIYTSHLNTILMGTKNTPVFNYETKRFNDSVRLVYQDFINHNPDSSITWVLKEYFAYLDTIDYTLDFNNCELSKVFFDTCDWLVSEGEKRVKK